MKIKNGFIKHSLTLVSIAAALTAGLAACGGGASTASTSSNAPTATPVAAAAGTTSSGVITAFGSVFVGGHEFGTAGTSFIDDDTGKSTASAAGLEVGMVVDVKPAAGSSATAPQAGELHVHPLARGYVDALDTTLGTLKVMGQLVQLSSSTNFSDHRACVSATPATCTAVSTPTALISTVSAGSPGSYVTVHGYLFGTAAGSANIVATLVSVSDVPTASTGVNFKAEGLATVSAGSLSIGGLSADLSKAVCRVAGVVTPCASAFSTGQVVSVGAAAAPVVPAIALVADFARLASKTSVDTSGSAMEVEGVVSSPSASGFVLRGVTINTTALAAGTTAPQAGDVVRVLGTVDSSGQSVTASSVTILHTANSVKLGLEGDATGIAAGAVANSFTLSVLGQTITVNAQTQLMDMSVKGWDMKPDPASNPFNISTFATYLAASGRSQHVIVKAETNGSGNLVANSLAIVPASTVTGVSGLVDATVVNSKLTGTPSTLSVHGIAISVDPAAVLVQGPKPASYPTIAAGDQVVALGSWGANTLSVAATVSRSNQLFDAGVPGSKAADRGEF